MYFVSIITLFIVTVDSNNEIEQKSVCNKPKNDGTIFEGGLKNPELRFYFNNKTQRCEAFQFYGPHVNENNFGSVKECFEFCKAFIKEDIKTARVLSIIKSKCLQPEHPASNCSGNSLEFKYIFDQESLQCIARVQKWCKLEGTYNDEISCAESCYYGLYHV